MSDPRSVAVCLQNTPVGHRLHSAIPRPCLVGGFSLDQIVKMKRNMCAASVVPSRPLFLHSFISRAPRKDGILNTTLSLNTTFTTNGARSWPGVGDRQSWHKMNGTTELRHSTLPPSLPPDHIAGNVLKAKKEL